jgi:hypothetical protein
MISIAPAQHPIVPEAWSPERSLGGPPYVAMDQSRFFMTGDNDRLYQPTPTGQMISVSSSEPQIQYAGQPQLQSNPAFISPVDHAQLFRHASFPQQFEHLPLQQFPFSIPNSPSSLPRHPLHGSLFTAILNHPEIARHRDSVCNYLRLTPSLWEELYHPEQTSPVHHELTRYLSGRYGKLPADLWKLIDDFRAQQDFAQSQEYFVDTIVSIIRPHSVPPMPISSSEFDGQTITDEHSEQDSPIQVRVSGAAEGVSTSSNIFVASSRKSQAPYRRAKGRAPKGERYKCPYLNCKHEPFRNAGNFNNHMRSVHAESEYRKRHPSEFLMPDSSPQPSSHGDAPSSVGTGAAESPVSQQRMSRESSLARTRTTSVSQAMLGDNLHPFAAHGLGPMITDFDMFQSGLPIQATSNVVSRMPQNNFGTSGLEQMSHMATRSDGQNNPLFQGFGQSDADHTQYQVMERQPWMPRTEG